MLHKLKNYIPSLLVLLLSVAAITYIIQMIDKILESKYIQKKSTKIYIGQETSPIDHSKDKWAIDLGHWTIEDELVDIQEDLQRIANKTDNKELYKIVDKLEIILTRK